MKFDKINMIYGLIATIGAALFGEYWFLFAGFLILNVIDYATGYCKANTGVSTEIRHPLRIRARSLRYLKQVSKLSIF